MVWRRLRPGEIDHELTWLCVTVACAAAGWLWLHLGLPHPDCLWHKLTGVACPTCGATRCVRHLTHGAWAAAFLVNPLIFLTLAGGALYDLYAATVLALRLPRLRFDEVSSRAGTLVRFAFLAALLGNWAWLIHRGI